MSPRVLCPSTFALAAVLAGSVTAQDAIGVIADRGSPARRPYVHVFDPASMQVTASVPLPLPDFAPIFDVEIAPDLSEGYVADFVNAAVWVVDLHANPPALAAGVNPIDVVRGTSGVGGALSASASDLALTPDGDFLLVAGGNALGDGGSALGVVDLRTREVVDSFDFSPNSPTAVEVGPDGSVFVVELIESQPSFANTNVRRLRIDAAGRLRDIGEVAGLATLPGVQDVIVPSYDFLPPFLEALTARHVVHVSRPAGGALGSLRARGLSAVDVVALADPSGIALNFDPFRSIVYARTNELPTFGGAGVGNARIDGYRFSPLTGRIGQHVVSIPLDRMAGTAFGVEQTAVDPVLRRIYVSGLAGGEVRVFDAVTGSQVGTSSDPDFLFGLGIEIRRR